jgi:hypothetical protein
MTPEEKRELFHTGLLNIFIKAIAEYDNFMKSEMAEIASIESSIMGNFTDPSTGNKYGYKLSVGRPDFYEEEKQQSDEDCFDDE